MVVYTPIIPGIAARHLAPQPVSSLCGWLADPAMPGQLERLGIETLGALAKLPAAAIADRFGAEGLRARRLARGGGERLLPREPVDDVSERIDLPDAAYGAQLERALELLIRRLLASPARRGRSFRSLRLTAGLTGGGGWSATAALRRASASAQRLRLALEPRLAGLPEPALWLRVEALALGPPAREQLALTESERERRRERLAEAVRQVRAAAGRDAVLRVLELDPASHVPERRLLLAPW